MAGNGAVRLEDLPPELQAQVAAAAGVVVPKKHRGKHADPVSTGDIVEGAALVMAALHKSKLPASSWYLVLAKCQRWTRNPARMSKVRRAHAR